MNLAFALFKYFPFGGLQRDMMRMAEKAVARGHQVTVFVSEWKDAPLPAETSGLSVRFLKTRALTNHGAMKDFERRFQEEVRLLPGRFDLTVAFNRIAGCDFYFAADNCLAAELPKKHSRLSLRFHPRYRVFLQMESAIFSPRSETRILYIAPRQKTDYSACYGTQEQRFFLLPPGMNPACRRPETVAAAESLRVSKRAELGLSQNDLALLLLASNFDLKGGDRVIRALASLPPGWKDRCVLCLAGPGSVKRCMALASALGVSEKIRVLGGRNDVPELLLASDLMVHPAREESAGSVLVEGIASGLPVLCSGECGFSPYVRESGGTVLSEPFSQQELNEQLKSMLPRLEEISHSVRSYAGSADFCRREEVALEYLESAFLSVSSRK